MFSYLFTNTQKPDKKEVEHKSNEQGFEQIKHEKIITEEPVLDTDYFNNKVPFNSPASNTESHVEKSDQKSAALKETFPSESPIEPHPLDNDIQPEDSDSEDEIYQFYPISKEPKKGKKLFGCFGCFN